MDKIVLVILVAIVVIIVALIAGGAAVNYISSQPSVQPNTIYFINSTPYWNNYLIVLNQSTYSQIMQVTHNNMVVMYISSGGSGPYQGNELYIEKIIPSGNNVYIVVGSGFVPSNTGSSYTISIPINPTSNNYYYVQVTYKGNWVGPIP
jgi:hypothetical protein